VAKPFHKPGWVYEEKYDGIRLLAYKKGRRVRLMSRNAKDRTADFPGIAAAIGSLTPATLLLDGEAVVFDGGRVSRFQLLQQGAGEAVYAVFDCLYCDGRDLRRDPLTARRAVLDRAVGRKGALLVSRRLGANGLEAYREARRRGFEGLVAKDESSPYVQARSTSWLKVKVHQEEEFVIGGFTKPAGTRSHLGALLLGAYADSDLRYVGKVGTGFSQDTLESLHRRLRPLVTDHTPFVDLAREKDATFVRPELVAQISFQEWTADRRLRQPVFLGLRDDKAARDVVLTEPSR
jgi:bifunctional non-homologous end joining protein LigD